MKDPANIFKTICHLELLHANTDLMNEGIYMHVKSLWCQEKFDHGEQVIVFAAVLSKVNCAKTKSPTRIAFMLPQFGPRNLTEKSMDKWTAQY